jgi:hypothetical protein
MSESDSKWSVKYVVAGVFLIVVGITWCCAASSYAGSDGRVRSDSLIGMLPETRKVYARKTVYQLLYNGLVAVPSAPYVLSHTWNNEPLILQIGGGLAVLVLVGGGVMRAVESRLNQPVKRHRRR